MLEFGVTQKLTNSFRTDTDNAIPVFESKTYYAVKNMYK